MQFVRPSVKRWCYILFLALLGALFVAYLGNALNERVLLFGIKVFGWNDLPFGLSVLAGAGIVLILSLHHAIGIAPRHLKHFFRYPPLPLAVSLALLLSLALPVFTEGWLASERLTADETLIFVALYNAVWGFQLLVLHVVILLSSANGKTNGRPAATPEQAGLLKLGALQRWYEREEPVSDRALDLFGYHRIARRILERIEPGGVTLALHGSFGSGKSTVCSLAANEARMRNLPWLFVTATCWGFKEPIRAQQQILEAVLARVATEVDCLAIRQLPTDYVDAMTSQGGWLGAALRLWSTPGTPLEQLQRLSPILSAIRHRVVVVIEDVDRNGEQFDVSQIQALLMQLREVSGLSFILATSSDQHSDLLKVCDHLEIMPSIERGEVLRILDAVRELLTREHAPGVLLAEYAPLVSENGDYSVLDHYAIYSWPWQQALADLLNRPRLLKHALRRLARSWPSLAGEVSFDDLLSIIVLRIAAPEAFVFLRDRGRQFRVQRNGQDKATQMEQSIQTALEKDWSDIAAKDSFDARAAACLLGFLDKAAVSITGVPVNAGTHEHSRQSLHSSRRREIYAHRLFSEDLGKPPVTDQTIARLLRQGGAPESLKNLASIIVDSAWACAVFEDLAEALRYEHDLTLQSEVYAEIRNRGGALATRDDFPGFYAPWRRAQVRRGPEVAEWLERELLECIPSHLRLLTDIYHFWVGPDSHRRTERRNARRAIVATLQTVWDALPPAVVAKGFDSRFPWTLFHLVFTAGFANSEEVPLGSVDDWGWSGEILYRACEADPEVMLPQILIALNKDSARGGAAPQYELDDERLLLWFGENAKTLLGIAAAGCDLNQDMPQVAKYLLEQAFEQAEEYLSKVRLLGGVTSSHTESLRRDRQLARRRHRDASTPGHSNNTLDTRAGGDP